jgi:hypothetical protein
MVKIRYAELPAGLHVDARTHYGDTVVYLLPGLTTEQRRAALTRVRSSGRMGHGPRLSATSMALAVGTDRVRTTASNGASAVRGHPLLLLPSLLVMSGTFFALVSLIALVAGHASTSGRVTGAGMNLTHAWATDQPVSQVSASHFRQFRASPPGDVSWTSLRRTIHRETGFASRRRDRRHEFPRAAWSARGLQEMSPSPAQLPASTCVVLGVFGGCWTS